MIEVNGSAIACHATITHPDSLTLLHFHGNGETIADYVDGDFHQFYQLGVNVVFVEYRGYGRSTGQPQLSAMLGDGECVVRQLGLAFDRVVAFGRSMGSLYAIELASRHPELAGLVIESGIADPAERFLKYADLSEAGCCEADVRRAVAEQFDHQKKMAAFTNPVLILHAENDQLIPISHAERNHSWSGSTNRRLIRFPYGNHNTIMPFNAAEYFQGLRDFLEAIDRTE